MMGHVPVLLHEVIQGLNPKAGEHFIDATLGGGGHAIEILRRTGPDGRLLAIDRDEAAILRFRNAIAGTGFESRVSLALGNFADADVLMRACDFPIAHGLVADLGFSSFQLAEGRGFSFQADEPLIMRYDKDDGLTAAAIINGWSEREIADLVFKNSGERLSRRIAKAIVEARKKSRILTTAQLAEVITQAVPKRYEQGRLHPATRTFMALRIAVNEERESLDALLQKLPNILVPGGRAAIISFQSIEDAAVKNAFRDFRKSGRAPEISKKPIIPSDAEIAENPRARSAKLRIIQFS